MAVYVPTKYDTASKIGNSPKEKSQMKKYRKAKMTKAVAPKPNRRNKNADLSFIGKTTLLIYY